MLILCVCVCVLCVCVCCVCVWFLNMETSEGRVDKETSDSNNEDVHSYFSE